MIMKLTDLVLLSLQTAFMQKDLTTKGFCAGLQGKLREAAFDTYKLLMYSNLDSLQDTEFGHSIVDELAWQFHCDYYDKTANIETKKNLVKQSIRIHRTKGTPQAVLDLLKTAFPADTILLEWFEYGGEPYQFKIITSGYDGYDKEKFMQALNSVKNARSYLVGGEVDIYTTVFHYALNNIKIYSEYSYTPSQIVAPSEPLMLAFGEEDDYEVYSTENGDNIGF